MLDGKLMVLITYLIINIVGFIIMGVDKKKAEKHQYRIPERTLWLVALFGGAIGTTAGMQLFRHKTKHATFKFGFPLLALIDMGLLVKFL